MVKLRNEIVVFEHNRRAEPPVNLVELARRCGYKVNRVAKVLEISTRQLERQFLDALGVSPKYWMRLQRSIRARHLIREGTPLKAVALELGFLKYDKFAQEMRHFYNLNPMEMVSQERRNCYDAALFQDDPEQHEPD